MRKVLSFILPIIVMATIVVYVESLVPRGLDLWQVLLLCLLVGMYALVAGPIA